MQRRDTHHHKTDHEILAMQAMINQEAAPSQSHAEEPAERRRQDLLRNFKYLQRIRYGSMETICQVLACKYYYRPKSVYALIRRSLEQIAAEEFQEEPVAVGELYAIAQQLKTPHWMDNTKRRHQDIRDTFRQWQGLGNQAFLCRILGHHFYYYPESIQAILNNQQKEPPKAVTVTY